MRAALRRLLPALWLWLSLAFACGLGARSEPAGQVQPYFFDIFSTDSGLPQMNVTAAVQTRDGYLWVGTEGGLGRFDGVRFVNWRQTHTPELINHSIRCLFESAEGTLWIGTDHGLVRRRRDRFEPAGLEGHAVVAICQDASGALWIGTADAGLHVLRHERIEAVTSGVLPGDASVQCVYVDSARRIWVGLRDRAGVVVGDGAKWEHWVDGGRLTGETNAICEFPAGHIWLANAHGLYCFDGKGFRGYGKDEGLTSMQVRAVRPAHDGGLWVAAGGLHRVFAGPTDPFRCVPLPSPAVRNIHQLCEDVEGNVWLCASAEGLVRARQAPFRVVAGVGDPTSPVVKSVSEDTAGNLWVAVQRGNVVCVRPDGSSRQLTARDGLLSSNPLAVLAARDGAVWIAYSSGLCVWRDGQVETSRRHFGINAIFEDLGTTIWFGGQRGVVTYDRTHGFRELALPGSEPLHVFAFAQGQDGTMYVGHSGGILKVRDRRVVPFDEMAELNTAPVRALHVDGHGQLWVGTKGRGLGVWTGREWLNPDTLADALSDHVAAIGDVGDARLWLGTPSGVVWAEKEDLLAVARGERALPRLRAAGQGDGARVMPVSSGAQPAAWKTVGGDLLFATRLGLVRLQPRDVRTNRIAPQVHIEQITVDGQTLGPAARFEIPAGRRSVAIDYAAPSFVNSSRVTFHYHLEGYEKEWVSAGSRRSAFYTNLPPGDYVFRVRAANSDGVESAGVASVRFTQRPHFHQTWWFALLAAGGVFAAVVGVNRWSHRRLAFKVALLEEKQAADRDRRRIAKDLHDDIGASLTEIGLFAQKMKTRPLEPEVAGLINFLVLRIHRVTAALDAVVWAVNPANDTLDRLAGFIVEMCQDFIRLTTIRCRFEVPAMFPELPLLPEERSHIFLTTKEAINNLVRHSEATEAWVRMKTVDRVFELTIEDNGCGFDVDDARSRGNGLGNMRSRVEELGGVLEIESEPGKGTRLSLRVPLRLRPVASPQSTVTV